MVPDPEKLWRPIRRRKGFTYKHVLFRKNRFFAPNGQVRYFNTYDEAKAKADRMNGHG